MVPYALMYYQTTMQFPEQLLCLSECASQPSLEDLTALHSGLGPYRVTPIKLETGLRPNSAGIPYALLLRIEAIGFPTFRHLL